MHNITNKDSSLINSRLHSPMHILIFQYLPAIELIESAGKVCKQWKKEAEICLKSRRFYPVHKEEKVMNYLAQQWSKFESFVKSKGFSNWKENHLLSLAKQAFSAGAKELGGNINPTDSNDLLGDNLFETLLKTQACSNLLAGNYELKELFLSIDEPNLNILLNFLTSGLESKTDGPEFLEYLIKKHGPSLSETEMEETIVYLCKHSSSDITFLAHLETVLKELSAIHGADRIERTVSTYMPEIEDHLSRNGNMAFLQALNACIDGALRS